MALTGKDLRRGQAYINWLRNTWLLNSQIVEEAYEHLSFNVSNGLQI